MEISYEQKLEIVREVMRERASNGGKNTRDQHPDHFKEMNRKSHEAKRLKKLTQAGQPTCETPKEEV